MSVITPHIFYNTVNIAHTLDNKVKHSRVFRANFSPAPFPQNVKPNMNCLHVQWFKFPFFSDLWMSSERQLKKNTN